jgi:hypothetical protein
MVNRGERRECVKPRADAPAQFAAVGCSVRPRSPPPGLWPERQLLGAHEGRIADAYEAKQLADVHAALLGGAISAEANPLLAPRASPILPTGRRLSTSFTAPPRQQGLNLIPGEVQPSAGYQP